MFSIIVLSNYLNKDNGLWFQQDGTPAYNTRPVRQYLDLAPKQWIGQRRPTDRPARFKAI